MDQIQLDNDKFEIQAEVCDPIVKDGVQKYVVYTLKGLDKLGSFEVIRRYSDFTAIRSILLQRWPGCFIPPLPPKKVVGNMDSKFIEERKLFLDLFLKKVATLKWLWYSEEFDIFIRSNSSDIEKSLNTLPKQSYQDLITKYEKHFLDLSGKEINAELLDKIGGFQNYLKNVYPTLESFKNMAKNLLDTRQNQNEQIGLMLEYLLPEYEKNCLEEYVVNPENKMIFRNEYLYDNVQKLKNANNEHQFEELLAMIRVEQREIEAFQETIQGKEKYEQLKLSTMAKQKDVQQDLSDVQNGKTTFKSLFSKGNKEEAVQKLNTQLDNIQKDIDSLVFLCDVIIVIIGYEEIDRFKQEKEQTYFELLKNISQCEIENAKQQQELWNQYLSDPNLDY